ncbi:MAG: 4Fe-4S binding protein [Deltaproteobacteria bacterium]|nr:MAG: 4Fe-4S binding protein [Deltaproteobacteria bacterium]
MCRLWAVRGSLHRARSPGDSGSNRALLGGIGKGGGVKSDSQSLRRLGAREQSVAEPQAHSESTDSLRAQGQSREQSRERGGRTPTPRARARSRMEVRAPRKLQVARRPVQIGVVLVIVMIPAVSRYHNYLAARELDRKIESWQGTVPGALLAGIDRVMRALPGGEVRRDDVVRRNRQAALERAQQARGGAWSAEIGPLSLTDPLAAAESIAATGRVRRVLLIGIALPVLITLLLGRVFCSWICPVGFLLEMTDKLRRVLRVLELSPRNLRFARATKYALLVVGIALSAVWAMPVLGYVYPPALLSRELHDAVFAMFDRAELGLGMRWSAGLSWMVIVLLLIALFEVTLSRRWWCRYVCPGGGLYSLIGAARPVRVKLESRACTECALCVAACPMGLNPMRGEMGIECDNCGVCIGACDDDALSFAVSRPRTGSPRPGAPAGATSSRSSGPVNARSRRPRAAGKAGSLRPEVAAVEQTV